MVSLILGNLVNSPEAWVRMLAIVKELFGLLRPDQKRRFYLLQLLVVLMTLCEMIGVASIAPFMALVGDPDLLERGGVLSDLYELTGAESHADFLFIVGLGVLFVLVIASLVSILTTWQLSTFSVSVGTEIGNRLYEHYLKQSWLFHSTGSSAQLTKKIANESSRVSSGIIRPLMQINARIIFSLCMGIGLFIYNPYVVVFGGIIFFVSYYSMYKVIKIKLKKNGETISNTATVRFRLMNEGFGGIREIILSGKSHGFIDDFKSAGKQFSKANGRNLALGQVPRYFMELVAFGAMIILVLYLVKVYDGDLGFVLPVISLYALAGFKLLPAFQQIYMSIATIRGALPAYESIRVDLQNSVENFADFKSENSWEASVKQGVSFEKVSFTYPEKNKPAIDKMDMWIPSKKTIGIVGASGSGKSTMIDLLVGLLEPSSGSIMVDGIDIHENHLRKWRRLIGFVPQSIFLTEGSVAENVAFGLSKDEIDVDKVILALKKAHLEELVLSLDQGVDTLIGERGVQLSGGQRQRLGIARALYNDPEVLIFDEATSALDGVTEKSIMEAIHDFKGEKTIIMIAHRIKTVVNCDMIFVIDKGKVIDHGPFDELVERNDHFREMAKYA